MHIRVQNGHEFGSNISAAWLVPSNAVINAFVAKITYFVLIE
jgi:hypothetical protein